MATKYNVSVELKDTGGEDTSSVAAWVSTLLSNDHTRPTTVEVVSLNVWEDES